MWAGQVVVRRENGGFRRGNSGSVQYRDAVLMSGYHMSTMRVCKTQGGLQFSSRPQPPRCGQGVPEEGGGVEKFSPFGGIFEFPVSF